MLVSLIWSYGNDENTWCLEIIYHHWKFRWKCRLFMNKKHSLVFSIFQWFTHIIPQVGQLVNKTIDTHKWWLFSNSSTVVTFMWSTHTYTHPTNSQFRYNYSIWTTIKIPKESFMIYFYDSMYVGFIVRLISFTPSLSPHKNVS